jgi:hypothetical protein
MIYIAWRPELSSTHDVPDHIIDAEGYLQSLLLSKRYTLSRKRTACDHTITVGAVRNGWRPHRLQIRRVT